MLKQSKYIHFVSDDARSDRHYVVSALNRKLLNLDRDEFDQFCEVLQDPNRDFSSDHLQGIKYLLERMEFLIPEDHNELQTLEQQYWDEKRQTRNFNLGIVLTQQCNLRCIYCNQEHLDKRFSRDDELSTVSFVEREIHKFKVFNMTWWGGEPLLRMDLIQSLSTKLLEVCARHGLEYNAFTSTNATLITDKVAEELLACKFVKFQVSLDGPEIVHNAHRPQRNNRGSFDLVVRGINALYNAFGAKPELINLRIHVSKLTPVQVESWYPTFDKLEAARACLALHFTPVHETFRFAFRESLSDEEFKVRFLPVMEEARRRGFLLLEDRLLTKDTLLYCGAIPDASWFVLPGGFVTRCNDTFNNPKDFCGKIEADGRLLLYETAKKWIDYSPFSNEICRECNVLPLCMGGCNVVPIEHPSGARCHIKHVFEDAIRRDPRAVGNGCLKCNISKINQENAHA
jgi:uncharacterized protein